MDETNVPQEDAVTELPIVVLSPELIDTAIVAWEDLYLLLVKQNKITIDDLTLNVIGATLKALKASYPFKSADKIEETATRTTRSKRDKPSDVKRPTR